MRPEQLPAAGVCTATVSQSNYYTYTCTLSVPTAPEGMTWDVELYSWLDILSQPQNVSVPAGSNATFTVRTACSTSDGYQWRFNGTNLADNGRIAGSLSNSLSISNVRQGDAGGYSVVVHDPLGAVTSSVATLTVQVLPAPCSTVIFSENFESGQLPAEMAVSTVGTFSSPPGIQSITNFGASMAFGFGRSTCPANCFDGSVSTLTITLPAPTYISELSFQEMELYGNWGSEGEVLLNGVRVNQLDSSGLEDFGRVPVNDGIADTTFRTHQFVIDEVAMALGKTDPILLS